MRFWLTCGGLRGCGVVLALVSRDGGAHLLLGDEELHAVRLAQVRVERAHLVASPVAVCRVMIQCFSLFQFQPFKFFRLSNDERCYYRDTKVRFQALPNMFEL